MRHKPGPSVFKQNVTGDLGARSRRPPLPPESPVLEAARESTRSAGAAAGARSWVRYQFAPSPGSRHAGSARRPPSSSRRAHRGLPAVKRAGTPGHPRAPESLGSPFGSRPVSWAYLCAGPGNTARNPGHVWCGVPGVLSVNPPYTKLGAGGREGRGAASSRDWRPCKPIICLIRPMTSLGGVARTLTPPCP